MLGLMSGARTFVVTQPIDGRKGADSLMVLVRDVFAHDPLSGNFYVFFSRRCDGVRIVYWDRDGIALWSKRLERGRYRPKFSADGRLRADTIDWAELALVLEGIELADARRRPRWEPTKKSVELRNSSVAPPV